MRAADRLVLDLVAVQRGHLSRGQALAAGLDVDSIKRRVRSGAWLRMAPGVYKVATYPAHPDDALWVAYLAVGAEAVVSHECAAARRGLRAVIQDLIVLTAGRGTHHRVPGATVHQLLDVLPHHIEELDGFRITTVSRTIVDCAAVVSRVRLRDLARQSIDDGLTTAAEIEGVAREIDRVGKPGIKGVAGVLGDLAPREVIGDTELERMLLRAVLGAGNPMPVSQFAHPGRHPGRGRVDFAYPDLKVILEADGRPWHQRIADLRRDRYRDNEAARAGWVTLRFMFEELIGDPDDVGAAVREVLAERTRLFSRQ